MNTIRIIQIIAGLAGLGALILGLLFWIANINLLNIHMSFGVLVVLTLLALAILAVLTKGLRMLGVVGIVYAPLVLLFGLTQSSLLVGNLHWLIQTAHLLVGLGALALIGIISTRYLRLKQSRSGITVPSQATQ